MSLKIIIIEDEPAIARNLEFMLVDIDPNITVLKKINSVKESINWLIDNSNTAYDLLFMDIRLTDGLSFEIFESITPNVPVIFITAYDTYAIEAFKVNSIDYILKPFEKNDLIKALEKYRNLYQHKKDDIPIDKMNDLLDYFKSNKPENKKRSYLAHFQNKLIPLSVDKIKWFYTSQDIVYAYIENGDKFIIESSLEKIQIEISTNDFFRANRQYIINRHAIKDIDFYFNGRLVVNVVPKPQEKIIISKAKAPEFKKWIDQ